MYQKIGTTSVSPHLLLHLDGGRRIFLFLLFLLLSIVGGIKRCVFRSAITFQIEREHAAALTWQNQVLTSGPAQQSQCLLSRFPLRFTPQVRWVGARERGSGDAVDSLLGPSQGAGTI